MGFLTLSALISAATGKRNLWDTSFVNLCAERDIFSHDVLFIIPRFFPERYVHTCVHQVSKDTNQRIICCILFIKILQLYYFYEDLRNSSPLMLNKDLTFFTNYSSAMIAVVQT